MVSSARVVGLAITMSVLAPFGAARAEYDELAISVGGAWRLTANDDGSRHAVGVSFGGHLGVDDFWQIGASGEVVFPVAGPDGVGMSGGARFDVRWLFDVLTWVPFLELSAGFRVHADTFAETWEFGAIALGSFGLDYRPERDWSIGFRAGAGAVFFGAGVGDVITRVDLQAIFHFD